MEGWTIHEGIAVALRRDNVDTDQLIPARFMSTPRSDGYGKYLLYDVRRNATGELKQDFPLNRHGDVSILVTGRNFGSGSSREAAVYALLDAGIRVVVAPSFADIFASNAVNNGLLAAKILPGDVAGLFDHLGSGSIHSRVNLGTSEIELGQFRGRFLLGSGHREKLIKGWDDTDLTRKHSAAISAFRIGRSQAMSWTWPVEKRSRHGKINGRDSVRT